MLSPMPWLARNLTPRKRVRGVCTHAAHAWAGTRCTTYALNAALLTRFIAMGSQLVYVVLYSNSCTESLSNRAPAWL